MRSGRGRLTKRHCTQAKASAGRAGTLVDVQGFHLQLEESVEKDICPGPLTQWEEQRLPGPQPSAPTKLYSYHALFCFAVPAAVQWADAFRHIKLSCHSRAEPVFRQILCVLMSQSPSLLRHCAMDEEGCHVPYNFQNIT